GLYHQLTPIPVRSAGGAPRGAPPAFGPQYCNAMGSNQALLPGKADRMGAVRRVELAQDVRDVILDRALSQIEPGADIAVAGTLGEQLQHLALALGQLLRLVRARAPAKLAQELARHTRLDERLAGMDTTDRVDELRCRYIFEEVAHRAGFDGVEDIFF